MPGLKGVAVSDLNIAVPEMRHQEKKLFLHGSPDAPGDTERHAGTALANLQEEHAALCTFSTTQLLATHAASGASYHAMLADFSKMPVGVKAQENNRLDVVLTDLRKEHIDGTATLNRTGGNRTRAAEIPGIDRVSLWK
jgi:hypothetical protein